MQTKLLYFLLGAAGGAVATYIYMKDKYTKHMRDVVDSSLEEIEIAKSKLEYIADLAGFDVVDIDPSDMDNENHDDYQNLVNSYMTNDKAEVYELGRGLHAIELDAEAEEALAEVQHPRDSDEDDIFPEYAEDAEKQEEADLQSEGMKETFVRAERIVSDQFKPPYCITTELYDQNEVEHEYDVIELTFFEIDEVLIDDSETPVSKEETIGDITLETHWGFGDFPKDTLCVRNERKQVDYLVTRVIGAYGKQYYPERTGPVVDDQGRIIKE